MAFRHTTPEGRVYISHRPQVSAREAMVVSGHHYASQAGLRILEKGGNAIDAGVAAGICLSVLQTDMVSFLGVAPTMIYLAKEKRVLTISGLGRWPKAASIDWFEKNCGGEIPAGVRRAVTPAAADAWLTALECYGTMTFAEVAQDAISLADAGFPMHHFMYDHIKAAEKDYYRWESARPIYFPKGHLIPVGGRVRIPDLAETMRRMVRAEQRAAGGRAGGVRAARDEVYTGETARLMIDFIQREGGLMTMGDLADFHVLEEEPVATEFLGQEVYACGPWCQGPTLLEAMNILANFDLAALGHNSPAYLHTMMAALNLAFADREAFIGDPEFVDVPVDGLLSKEYAARQAERIEAGAAFVDMPEPGDPWAHQGGAHPWRYDGAHRVPKKSETEYQHDTSYCTAVDSEGNAFSCTPSDPSNAMPFVPGVGATVSGRGSQSWLDPAHPSCLAPWKRPRLTPNPALTLKDGAFYMTLGTPGGDAQAQVMLQVFLNLALFGMMPQMAVEAPRAATYNFPNSFWPHDYEPASARAEARLLSDVGPALSEMGYKMGSWPDFGWPPGSVCAIVKDPETGFLLGGADPRRESYAAGW